MEALGAVVADNIQTMSDGMRQYGEAGRDGIGVWQYLGCAYHRTVQQQNELKAEVKQTRTSRVKAVVVWVPPKWDMYYSEDGMREHLPKLGFR